MKILTEDWQPSQPTIDVLHLNGLDDEHIAKYITFIKTKFVNTSIDDVDHYDSWSSLFIMFCIKASKAQSVEKE